MPLRHLHDTTLFAVLLHEPEWSITVKLQHDCRYTHLLYIDTKITTAFGCNKVPLLQTHLVVFYHSLKKM